MASTTQEKKYARNYYRKNSKYREEKIEQRKTYAKEHRKKENEYAREYYHSNSSYKKWKIAYAAAYRKAHKKTHKK